MGRMVLLRVAMGACVVALVLAFAAAAAVAGEIIRNDHHVQSSAEPGATIYVREKLPAGVAPEAMGRAVLFVHGATYPGTSFDLPVPGYNWMDYVVERGYAAYYLDIRGYGYSTRPAAMAAPAEANPPFARTADAARDLADAVDFVRSRAAVDKPAVIGWSWGTVIAGLYASRHNDKIAKLVLYAPVYAIERPEVLRRFRLADPADPTRFNPAIGAYRTVTAPAARARWESQIIPDDKSLWREERVFRAWFDGILATDPVGAAREPPVVRAPNGVLVDVFEIFSGRPIYDAAEITVPTLVVRGADDPTSLAADALGLYRRLGTRDKAYVAIANGTHFISLERNAPKLFATVQAFLDR